MDKIIVYELEHYYSGSKLLAHFVDNGIEIEEYPGPMRPNGWWDCMVSEFRNYTRDMVGIVSLALIPEVIVSAWTVKCFWKTYF